jgi:hypothetical protein
VVFWQNLAKYTRDKRDIKARPIDAITPRVKKGVTEYWKYYFKFYKVVLSIM